MKESLMRYIPKEYKALVENIYEGEKEWNEVSKRWNVSIVVEWINGEISYFANKTFMKEVLKEQHTIDEFKM